MNLLARRMAMIATLLACGLADRAFVGAAEPSAEAVRASLSKQGFPWYDTKKDDFRHLQPPKPPEPETKKSSGSTQQTSSVDPSAGSLFQSLQKILMWGILIAVIAVIAAVAVRTWQDSIFEKQDSTPEVAISLEALEALPEPVRKVNDLLGEAARLAELSDFAAAILFYYSWQLVQLDRQQHIELQKGKTNRQYRREVSAAQPDLVHIFSSSMRLFEDAFFGQLPIGREEFMQVWDQRGQFEFFPRGGRS